ncbi:MAG TPA: hypothetical protein V6D12_23195 [Candidatus Obscuribacterales bacterium]
MAVNGDIITSEFTQLAIAIAKTEPPGLKSRGAPRYSSGSAGSRIGFQQKSLQ